jgi:hypothetical protein
LKQLISGDKLIVGGNLKVAGWLQLTVWHRIFLDPHNGDIVVRFSLTIKLTRLNLTKTLSKNICDQGKHDQVQDSVEYPRIQKLFKDQGK